jgi:glyoxylase-like metal-dependent hydrolase (beta-lactamase superfamily II)
VRIVLDRYTIQLIKGLFSHFGADVDVVQAYITRPEWPVPERWIRAIAEGRACADEAAYPTASEEDCRRFLDHWYEFRTPWRAFALARADAVSLGSAFGEFAFGYRYHPVGQGGFSSGWFTRHDDSRFHYVYDCGMEHGSGHARRAHVQREIDGLAESVSRGGTNPLTLDLVTVSHFDEDHLSGLTDLVSAFRVERLLLPHLTPWQRLCVVLERRAAIGSDLFAFAAAPTAFLRERFGERIGQIILVGPSGEVPDAPIVPPEEPPPEIRETTIPLDKFPVELAEGEWDDGSEGLGADNGLSGPDVKSLRAGGAISIDRLWEFVPYNDARMASGVTAAFKAAARPLVLTVRDHSRDEPTREAALVELRDLYDLTFKSRKVDRDRARRRNEISLFLYSGPVGAVELTYEVELALRHRFDGTLSGLPSIRWNDLDRFGQMFTGDGFLHSDNEWDAFNTFYRQYGRLRRAGIFQVPHHGSAKNWQVGRAHLIEPLASIFCSDPAGRHRHPHIDVRRDFEPWNAQQIDAYNGWQLLGWYSFRT